MGKATSAVLSRRKEADLERDSGYEFINGKRVPRNVSADASEVAVYAMSAIVTFARQRRLGKVLESEQGYQGIFPNPRDIRRADFAFFKADRAHQAVGGFVTIVPDLVGEVVSKNDIGKQVRDKVDLWLNAGVRVVWVLWPGAREVHVYRASGQYSIVSADQLLSGEDVIPGFEVRVAELFADAEVAR